jgi:hypothetical protein
MNFKRKSDYRYEREIIMTPKLIVMLTYNDVTVKNAVEVFEQAKDSPAEFWGFKEAGIPKDEMIQLVKMMKSAGKVTFLEIVAYTEEECLADARVGVECGFDIIMGTMYFDSINDYLKENKVKYMPFVGKITGRPSILEGTIDGIIEEAKGILKKGVYGFDLLGYRFTGDAVELNRRFVAGVNCPVCLAGSVQSYQRLDEVKDADPWAFTIGGAFFENKFEGTVSEQITKVCDYMSR